MRAAIKRYLAAFALAYAGLSPLVRAADPEIVEVLKDAQATNRAAWKRGRANLRVEITTEGQAGIALVEGEVRWSETNFALKYKVSDPDEVRFRKHGVDSDWNFVVRGPDRVFTYLAKRNVLNERAPDPGSLDPIYELSPLPQFSRCCAPSASSGSLWSEVIGPSGSLSEFLREGSFSHRTLAGGDIEQIRVDRDGSKNTLVFSARDGFAVRSMRHLDPAGKLFNQIDYTYGKLSGGGIAPQECKAELRLPGVQPASRVRYLYTNVQLPGDVTTGEFSRAALATRIKRETNYDAKRKARAAPMNGVVDDAALDSLSRSLRKSNVSPRP